jgi:hypothetical protein
VIDYITSLVYEGGTVLNVFDGPENVNFALVFTDGVCTYDVGTFPSLSSHSIETEYDEEQIAFKYPCYFISNSTITNSSLLRSLAKRSGGQFVNLQSDQRPVDQISSSIIHQQPIFSFLYADVKDGTVQDITPCGPAAVHGTSFRLSGRVLLNNAEGKSYLSLSNNIATLVTVTLHYGLSSPAGNEVTESFVYTFDITKSSSTKGLVSRFWASLRVKDLEPMAEYSTYHKDLITQIGKKYK